MSEDKLVAIPQNDLPKLKSLYKKDWPKFINGCYVIDTFMRCMDKISSMKIYSLNGDWERDGTFIAIEEFYMYVDTLDENSDSLKKALTLKNLSAGDFIACFPDRLRPIIFEITKKNNLDLVFDSPTYSYYLPREDALKFEETKFDGITLKSLNPKDAVQINNIWPHRREGSKEFLEKIIRYDHTIGAYTKDGELIAWCLRLFMGSLGMLQVEEKYLRQGYGAYIAREISRLFATLGYDVTSNIVDDNYKSISLFEKLGFKKIDQHSWILLKDA